MSSTSPLLSPFLYHFPELDAEEEERSVRAEDDISAEF